MYRVLLVDDETVILEGLRKIVPWSELGCVVVGEAEDGETGLALVKKTKPHIVITDIRMPKISGLELISAIKSANIDCQIIILTGFRDFQYAQEAVKYGIFRFLVKPSKIEELLETLRDVIKVIKADETARCYYENMKKKIRKFYAQYPGKINTSSEERDIENQKMQYIVYKALQFMKNNFHKKLTLQVVSDALYVSTWHLSKSIKKDTGATFLELLNQIRLEKAQELLTQTSLKIYEVAGEIGFSDVAYFSRIFKNNTGMTPNQYRNKMYS